MKLITGPPVERLYRAYFNRPPLPSDTRTHERDIAYAAQSHLELVEGCIRLFECIEHTYQKNMHLPYTRQQMEMIQRVLLGERLLGELTEVIHQALGSPERFIRMVNKIGTMEAVFMLLHAHLELSHCSLSEDHMRRLFLGKDKGAFEGPSGRMKFTEELHVAWQKRIALLRAGQTQDFLEQAYLDVRVDEEPAKLVQYGMLCGCTDFLFEGKMYQILVGPGVLKMPAESHDPFQFAIIPYEAALKTILELLTKPEFEHFDGAIAIGGLDVLGSKAKTLRIMQLQTDVPHLAHTHNQISISLPNLAPLCLAGIRAHVQGKYTQLYLSTPYQILLKYGGYVPVQKLALYASEAERMGMQLVHTDVGILLPRIGENGVEAYTERLHFYRALV